MIKAYAIRYEEASKITIDTHMRIDKELEERRSRAQLTALPSVDGEFVEGIRAVVIDQTPTIEENAEKASAILEEAKKEARQILEAARREAESIKNEAYTEGSKKGYGDGLLQSQKEMNKLKAEYDEKARRL